MEQLPKIVTARLGAVKVKEHPDPNLLTGFAEMSLQPRERAQVLEHLARCGDCREVMILALPELAAQLKPAYSPSTWLGWPVLRWAAVASCVVVVGAAISLRHGSQEKPGRETAAVQSREVQSAEKVSEQISRDRISRDQDQPSDARGLNSGPSTGGTGATTPAKPAEVAHAPLALQDRARQEQDQAKARAAAAPRPGTEPATPAAAPPVSRMSAANAPALTKTAQGNAQPAEDQENDHQDEKRSKETARASADYSQPAANGVAAAPKQEVASSEASVLDKLKDKLKEDKAESDGSKKSGLTAGRLSTHLMQNEKVQSEDAPQLSAAGSASRWAVTSEGSLLRSVDAGKTWQTISPANQAGQTSFHAVTTVGTDVWVGGAAGVLFHSTDAGVNWREIKPSIDGQILSADIIGIEFKDSMHGKLTTAHQETWTTSDAGQTWQKQKQ